MSRELHICKAMPLNPNDYEYKWVCGYIWEGADHAYMIPSNLGIAYDDHRLSAYAIPVNRDTICDCLSIVDKHGLTLYENDIISATDDEYKYLIKWESCYYAAVLINKQTGLMVTRKMLSELPFYTPFGFKIEGNVFENPELLKGNVRHL